MFLKNLFLVTFVLFSVSCKTQISCNDNSEECQAQNKIFDGMPDDGGAVPEPIEGLPPTDEQAYNQYQPLLWESARMGTRAWSYYSYDVIKSEANTFFQGTADVYDFCPRYANLSNDQRINFWGMLISAMVRYESGFNPLSRMKEKSMGIDPITGLQVYSEGLLQLSYQDMKGYRWCAFDWEKDKQLSPTNPKKTILNPYTNLHCGIKILAHQIRRKGLIKLSRGAYWSVIKTSSKHQKISEIQALTKALPFCR